MRTVYAGYGNRNYHHERANRTDFVLLEFRGRLNSVV